MSLATAKQVLKLQSRAIGRLAAGLDGRFERAVNLMYRCRSRVVLTGMGKPGFIAQKISSSLASTGTSSIYVHPADAVHGDIGRITKQDIILALSKSGETEEMVRLLPIVKRIGCKIIAITANPASALAQASEITLIVGVDSEAEPLNVVPTTSTACMLALGDALTMALVKKRGFRQKDFAMLHPGGSIGKALHLTVGGVMRRGREHPCVKPTETMKQVLIKITAAKAGSATVVDARGRCIGIFTDGDLRRRFSEITSDLKAPISGFMTRGPITVRLDQLAVDAAAIFRKRRIDELPVIDRKGRAVGLLDVQDLLKQGFII